MNVRPFDKKNDYSTVCKWWDEYKQHPAPIEFLSEFGFIVEKDNKAICAIWLYPIVSVKFALVKSPIANPDTTKEERNEGLNLCLDTVHILAKELGYTHTFCPSNVPAFENRLSTLGYVPGDKNCTHYWGGL